MDKPEPQATVREIAGELVLDDPIGLALLQAVAKHNCKNTFKASAERVSYFRQRADELASTKPSLIVLLNVDDPRGGPFAELLMPNNGAQWESVRAAGGVPFASGLARRDYMQILIEEMDAEAGAKLRAMSDVIPVVVMDHGVIAVFRADGGDVQ